ncbi:MAG TPA: MFS transporter [bacterium]|jgi:MFS family permease
MSEAPSIENSRTLSSYASLIVRNRNFRLLWTGQIISLLGDWFNLVATTTLTYKLTGSAEGIGYLFVVRALAPFLISPVAGVVADRYNRRRILIGTDIIRALIVFGFFLIQDSSHIWILFVLLGLLHGTSGFFIPAYNAMLPEIVEQKDLGTANALSSVTWSVMYSLGMALGGLVAGLFGLHTSYTVDALSFILSAIIIYRILYLPSEKDVADGRTFSDGVRQHLDGLKYLAGKLDILNISLSKAVIYLSTMGGIPVVIVAISEKIFSMGEGGAISTGIMFSVWGIGSGVGPIMARRFTGDNHELMRKLVAASYVCIALGTALAGFHSIFVLVFAGLFINGFGIGVVWVFTTQLLMQLVPNEVRGRIFAAEFAFFTVGYAICAAMTGWMTENLGLQISGTLWILSSMVIVPFTVWILANKFFPHEKVVENK